MLRSAFCHMSDAAAQQGQQEGDAPTTAIEAAPLQPVYTAEEIEVRLD